ncbi:MAG: beta-N-acetylglucosaminidase domain-containing protein [Pseudomonadales bacterium]|nr:beta-N-acetylglucosaminidase domain-containing protein [Pseudomonadales bacterium]
MSENCTSLPLGLIEGFYGPQWSHDERLGMMSFLSEQGFSSYCYAPKSDPFLRNSWQQDWPVDQFEQLLELSHYARSRGLNFSVGFTPLNLHKNWLGKGAAKSQLKKRLKQLKALELSGISILFDDMWGDDAQLAPLQVEISHFIADELGIDQVSICPSYYSFDPVLEQLFGARPANYWQSLGQDLDASINIFWTGDKVISESYSANSLLAISELFQRQPIIWDNSRVNDGRKTSPFLPVKAMPDINGIKNSCSGFIVNPMNAPHLAKVVLSTLCYSGTAEQRLQQALLMHGMDFTQAFNACLVLLTEVGLTDLSAIEQQQLIQLIQQHPNAISQDVTAWLEGKFIFDPACLT